MTREMLRSLIQIHQAEILRYLRYLGCDAGMAEDLAQDTFIQAYESRNPPTTVAPRVWSAWLRGIARNLFLMHCRKRRNTPVQVSTEMVEQAEDVWEEQFLRGDDGFDYVEALRACLRSLQKKQREALTLFYEQKLSREEVAARLSMTGQGVKSLLRRVRLALGECIRRRLHMEETG